MADNAVVLYEEDLPGVKLMKDPNDCSVEELKRWSQCHGLKKTGKEVELIDRVRSSNGKVKISRFHIGFLSRPKTTDVIQSHLSM